MRSTAICLVAAVAGVVLATAGADRLDLVPATLAPDAVAAGSAALGNVITIVDSSEGAGVASSIASGADGLPIISYVDLHHDRMVVVHCGDPACTSGNLVTTVDRRVFLGESTSIAIGADRLPVIAYSAMYPTLGVAHCGDVGCTSGNALTTIEPAGRGFHTSTKIGADGFPVIGYYDYGANAVRVAHCGDPACSQGNAVSTVRAFDSPPDLSYYASVAIGDDGLPVIGYYNASHNFMGDLEVVHCDNGDCSSAPQPIALDPGRWVGGAISAVIGADGLPLITYGDVGRASLKVAHCGSLDCTSGTTLTTVYPGGRGGSDTSVAIGTDGLPLISFCVDYAALYVAHCGDAACSSGNTVVAIDSGKDVGRFSSIAIGVDGMPVISYCGVGGTLKVAHCATPTCAEHFAPRVRRRLRHGAP
jgi:hypothetical protein